MIKYVNQQYYKLIKQEISLNKIMSQYWSQNK